MVGCQLWPEFQCVPYYIPNFVMEVAWNIHQSGPASKGKRTTTKDGKSMSSTQASIVRESLSYPMIVLHVFVSSCDQTRNRQNHYHLVGMCLLHVVGWRHRLVIYTKATRHLDSQEKPFFLCHFFTTTIEGIYSSYHFCYCCNVLLCCFLSKAQVTTKASGALKVINGSSSMVLLNGSLLAFSSLPHERENWAINSRRDFFFASFLQYSKVPNKCTSTIFTNESFHSHVEHSNWL